ncbi:MAG: hypothetical protein AAF432_00350 [Planctomycetota bacterium]
MPRPESTQWQRVASENLSNAVVPPDAQTTDRPTLFIPNSRVGMSLRVVGTSAEDGSMVMGIYAVETITRRAIDGAEVTGSPLYMTALMGSLTSTLGSLTGIDGSVVPSTERFADGMVWGSVSAYWTNRIAAYGVSDLVHSPANDSIAEIIFPDLGNLAGIALAPLIGGGTWNILVKSDI